MKYTLTLLFVLFTVAANAQLTNGLVAHWSFNGNVNDVSGNGHNGTPSNISYTTGKAGLANTAASFNGVNSRAVVAYGSDLNLSAYSICAMVKVNGYYTGKCETSSILSREQDHNPGHYSMIFSDNPFDNGTCNALDTSKYVFMSGAGGNFLQPGQHTAVQYTPAIVSGNWYCVIVTWDGNRLNTYVNSSIKSSVALNAIGTSGEGLTIGASHNINIFSTYPYWLNGILDDLRLYNRALTPGEISNYCGLFDTVVAIKDTARHACPDDTFHLGYVVNETFGPGNIFTAQLSDATGSFNTPVTIGTLTSSTGGKIVCNTPPSLTQGAGYKVRIVSTNPVRVTDIPLKLTVYNMQPATISIVANPAGPITPGQSVTFVATVGNGGPNPTIIWYRNGMQVPGINNDSLTLKTLNENDSIYAVVKSSNPCVLNTPTQSNVINVQINSSVNDIQLHNLDIYPNPNSGSFNITADNVHYSEIAIEIYNVIGQAVYRKQVKPVNKIIAEQINMPDVPNGIYMVRLSAAGKSRNIRLLIN